MITTQGLSSSLSALRELPIGLFDSGVGGMTVLRAMREQLPNESFLYLGDTARMPYGTKGVETVQRYALEAADKLVERGIKLLVIACNTATAAALPLVQAAHPDIDVVGVVEPRSRSRLPGHEKRLHCRHRHQRHHTRPRLRTGHSSAHAAGAHFRARLSAVRVHGGGRAA